MRRVVAQILEHGAALWRRDYSELEEQCRRLKPGFAGSLEEHVAERLEDLGEPFDPTAFRSGAEACLDSGAFVFVYGAGDLDDRTRQVMTYLAEGPRMTFFAVEFDYYLGAADRGSVLVPRTAFVPSWITGPAPAARSTTRKSRLDEASAEFWQLVKVMDDVQSQMGLEKSPRPTGWNYLPPVLEESIENVTSGVGVFATGRGMEISMLPLRDLGKGQLADDLLDLLRTILGSSFVHGRDWPSMPCVSVMEHWIEIRSQVVEPYFRARMASASGNPCRSKLSF